MAQIQWPFSTGRASQLLGDINIQPIPEVLESSVDAGRPKVRPVRLKYDELVSGFVYLTNAEKVTFDAWFASSARAGTLPFEWMHPVRNETCDMRFENRSISWDVAVGNSDPDLVLWGAKLLLRALAS